MQSHTFRISHSLLAATALVIIEALALYMRLPVAATDGVILAISIAGALVTIYAATEAVEEVRSSMHMFVVLSVVVAEFVVFFAFQYWFLYIAHPLSFPTLVPSPLSLLLASVMAFVFNPIYLPATAAGQALLLIETFGALGLVLFVLQNVGQFRRVGQDERRK